MPEAVITVDALRAQLDAFHPRNEQAVAAGDIADAQTCATRFDDWRTERIHSLDDMFNLPDPEPLIGGNILYTGSTSWLAGDSGTYKSFFALDWACCIATGTPWLGRPVRQGKVLYLSLEGSTGIKKRLGAWLDARQVGYGELAKALHFIRAADLSKGADGEMLIEAAQISRYALVVVDTQARATPGAKENDKDQFDHFIGTLTRMAQDLNVTSLVVHHSPKGGGTSLRGSSSMKGAADSLLEVRREKDTKFQAELFFEKQKDTEDGYSEFFELYEHMNSLVITNGTIRDEAATIGTRMDPEIFSTIRDYILGELELAGDIGMTRGELVREMQGKADEMSAELKRGTAYRVIGDLSDTHLTVLMGGSGEARQGARTVITDAGRVRVAQLRAVSKDLDD